jgi:hypothetical protein
MLEDAIVAFAMPSRIVLNDAELQEYSGEHLLYELQIFCWLTEAISTEPKGFRLSALLESFVIHLRNLTDFFYAAPTKTDDVVAVDFFDKATGWVPGNMSNLLAEARERANKEVSHITHKRKGPDDPTKPWPHDDLFKEIEAIAKTFANTASSKKLHASVVAFLNSQSGNARAILVKADTMTSNVTVQTSNVTVQTTTHSPGQVVIITNKNE